MEDKVQKSTYLYENIQTTRHCRVETEKRLLAYDTLVSNLTLFYGCVTIVLTLATIYCPEDRRLAFLSVASAIVVTLVGTVLSSRNYASRAERVKTCYIELQNLLFRVDAEDPKYKMSIDEAGEEYQAILKMTENQIPSDYVSYKYDKRLGEALEVLKSSPKKGFRQITKLIPEFIRTNLFRIILLRVFGYVIPILLGVAFWVWW